MKNIGIITHYYNSKNYGGILQAYALCRFINTMKYNAKQISYSYIKIGKRNFSIKFICKHPQNILRKIYYKLNIKRFNSRYNKLNSFNNMSIPHTDNVYTECSLYKLNEIFDCFITGSDQVWHPNVANVGFLLSFTEKSKIAYAASFAVSQLSNIFCEKISKSLSDYKAISVREKDAVDLLQPLTDKKVEWVLDPTLLLDKSDWDEICPERRIEKKYLFCYFLGADKRIRKLAKQYAKKHKLKIVTLPHLCGIAKSDIGFGDYKLYDVAPNDFISLIKYADCVFTDSFHACVFSGIYNKNFYVFNRLGSESMATRLYSLCELFECQDHFCDTDDKFNMDYIKNLQPIDYNKDFQLLKTMKEKSTRFLLDNLKD